MHINDMEYDIITMRGNMYYCVDSPNKIPYEIPYEILQWAYNIPNAYIVMSNNTYYVVIIYNGYYNMTNRKIFKKKDTNLSNYDSKYSYITIKLQISGLPDFTQNKFENGYYDNTKLSDEIVAMCLYTKIAIIHDNFYTIPYYIKQLRPYLREQTVIIRDLLKINCDIMEPYIKNAVHGEEETNIYYPYKYKAYQVKENDIRYIVKFETNIIYESGYLDFQKVLNDSLEYTITGPILTQYDIQNLGNDRLLQLLWILDKRNGTIIVKQDQIDQHFNNIESFVQTKLYTDWSQPSVPIYINHNIHMTNEIYNKLKFYNEHYNRLLGNYITVTKTGEYTSINKFYTEFKKNIKNVVKSVDDLNENDRMELCKVLSLPFSNTMDIKTEIYKSMKDYLRYSKLYNYKNNCKEDQACKFIIEELKQFLTYKKYMYEMTYVSNYDDDIKFIYLFDEDMQMKIFEILFLTNILTKVTTSSKTLENEYHNKPNYFDNPILLDKKFLGYVIIYEWVFGNYLQCSQLKMINDLINDTESNVEAKVHQLVMGSGKSSVIAPLITLIQLYENNKTVVHCMPYHLVSQSFKLFVNYISQFVNQIYISKSPKDIQNMQSFIGNVYITDDSTIKINMLEMAKIDTPWKLDDSQLIVFDEIHELGDNRMSEVNYTIENKKIDLDELDMKYNLCKHLFDLFYTDDQCLRVKDFIFLYK